MSGPGDGAMDRREMLRLMLCSGLALGGAAAVGLTGCPGDAAGASGGLREAMYYEKLAGNVVRCGLCPRTCTVRDGGRGYCGVRENRGGTYYSLVHGWASTVNLDPVEKKPLFHFLPGSRAFSIGTVGCNMECKDCQNWEISQVLPEQIDRRIDLPPATAVEKAGEYGAEIVAFTYNEPSVFYEFMRDTSELAQAADLRAVMISNGYLNRRPMLDLAPHLDAIKIDLKGFTDDFYRDYCAGTIEPVKESIRRVSALGKWLEIVYLVVPTVNDGLDGIRDMAGWLVRAVGPDVPLHFTRFHPAYKLTRLPPTPVETLEACRRAALDQGLHYVYVGNVPGHPGENTFCAGCGAAVIRRRGYQILERRINADGTCALCGRAIPGVWS